MKYIKTYENIQRFRVGDIIKYKNSWVFPNDIYEIKDILPSGIGNQEGYMTNIKSKLSSYTTFDGMRHLTKEEIEELKMLMNTNKYNI